MIIVLFFENKIKVPCCLPLSSSSTPASTSRSVSSSASPSVSASSSTSASSASPTPITVSCIYVVNMPGYKISTSNKRFIPLIKYCNSSNIPNGNKRDIYCE